MARIARIVLPNKPHLLRQAGDHPIFRSTRRRQAYLDILHDVAPSYRIKMLAWSILPSEVLMVVVPKSPQALSSFMRVVQARFARLVHAQGSDKEITPRRFASCPLDAEAAADAIKLVEHAAVDGKFAAKPALYEFSSAAVRQVSDNHQLLANDANVDRKIGSWTTWINRPLETDRREYLELRLRTGKPAGAPAFIKRVEKKVGMNLSRGRGRPPKKS